MRVLLIGMIYSDNIGDGIIYKCLESLLRNRGVEVVPCDLGLSSDWSVEDTVENKFIFPSIKKHAYNFLYRRPKFAFILNKFSWRYKKKEFENFIRCKINSVDSVIVGGGQLLTDIFFGLPPRIESIKKISKEYGKPISFLGCGVGATFSQEAQKIYRDAIGEAAFISVRGCASRQTLKSMSHNVEIYVHPDPAFIVSKLFPLKHIEKTKKKVGFCIQNFRTLRHHIEEFKSIGQDGYYKIVHDAIIALHRGGYLVELFTNGDLDDQKEAEDFVRLTGILSIADISIANRPKIPSDIYNLINSYCGVISFRMHAAIVAYSFNIPVINIVWDSKVSEVWEQFGDENVPLHNKELLSEKEFPWVKRLFSVNPNKVKLQASEVLIGRMIDLCVDRLRLHCMYEK